MHPRNRHTPHRHVELQGIAKHARKFLLDNAPQVGMSKNDLFNGGYGGFVTIAFGITFFVTFIYYSVTNSTYNISAKFLVPANGGSEGGMHCQPVAITLTNSYSIDSQGRWNSNTKFSLGDSLYGLQLVNSQYSTKRAYQEAMTSFADDLKSKSTIANESDYAWNIVFSGSYAVVAPTEGEGKSTLFVDGDSRMMYDVPIFTSGISSISGSCLPESYDFSYDGTSFVLKLAMNISSNEPLCPQLSDNGDLEEALGATGEINPSSDINHATFYFDAASITTAIAVNYKISTLDSLTPVPSLDFEDVLSAFIDESYAPMKPVYCFNATKFGFAAYGFSDLCLIKFGDMFAFPITSHYGNYGTGTFFPDACSCPTAGDSYCNHYDISVGLVFIPTVVPNENSTAYYYYYQPDLDDAVSLDEFDRVKAIILKILTFQINAQTSYQKINEYIRPLLAVSNEATYYAVRGEDFDYTFALDQLSETFSNICPECFVFSFELYDSAHFLSGPTINKGGRILRNMNCQNSFYKQDVLNVLINNPPSSITQDYLVCTDSMTTAVSTGISNAYASAQLYSATLLIVVVWLLMKFHDHLYRGPPINSTEEQEVLIRNAIVDVFAIMMSKQHDFTEEERKILTEKLTVIGITDPLTHAVNHGAIRAEYAQTSNGAKVAPAEVVTLVADEGLIGSKVRSTRSPSDGNGCSPMYLESVESGGLVGVVGEVEMITEDKVERGGLSRNSRASHSSGSLISNMSDSWHGSDV